MTTPNPMLAELDEVVRLAEKATPGPWALEHERSGDVSIVNREHQGDDWDIATVHYTRPANADLIAATINFIRTHHATLADMAKRLEAAERDARRYRWLRKRDVTFETEDGGEFIAFIPELGDDGRKLDTSVDAAIDATQEGEG